jgi:hypothetical protein
MSKNEGELQSQLRKVVGKTIKSAYTEDYGSTWGLIIEFTDGARWILDIFELADSDLEEESA